MSTREASVRILLVEDDPADARQIHTALRSALFPLEVADAATLSAAMQRLRATEFDVVLLDLGLPDGRGAECVKRVQEASPRVAILALTSVADHDLAAQAVRAGAHDCLVKGLPSSDSLLRCVRYANDRKNLEQQRLKLAGIEHERNRLREAIAAQEQLLGVVGHELRTPLASLRAISEILLTDVCGAPERENYLRAINQEVIRMADLVHDLLEAARLNSGAVQWKWGTVRVGDVCREALESIRPLVDADSVRLSCSVEPPGLAMRGDAGAIRRLLLNLLSNAQKHTGQGSILVVARASGDGVDLEVRDTGEGIRPEVGHRLGTPFALNSGNAGDGHVRGTGLGIAICKGIVAAHGGTMLVRSRRGGGTSVNVHLRGDLPRAVVGGETAIRLDISGQPEPGREAAA